MNVLSEVVIMSLSIYILSLLNTNSWIPAESNIPDDAATYAYAYPQPQFERTDLFESLVDEPWAYSSQGHHTQCTTHTVHTYTFLSACWPCSTCVLRGTGTSSY